MPASKELVEFKVRLPGALADFLDAQLAESPQFRGRSQLIAHLIGQARRRHRDMSRQRILRLRRRATKKGGLKVG